jgi:hypothetical protein
VLLQARKAAAKLHWNSIYQVLPRIANTLEARTSNSATSLSACGMKAGTRGHKGNEKEGGGGNSHLSSCLRGKQPASEENCIAKRLSSAGVSSVAAEGAPSAELQ